MVARAGTARPPGAAAGERRPPPPGGRRVAAVAASRSTTTAATGDNAGRVSQVIDGNAEQRLEDLDLPPAVPGAQAGRRDHGVVRVRRCSSPTLTIAVAEPGHRGARSARRPAADAALAGHQADRRGHAGATAPPPSSLAGSQPVTHVLVWITQLGGGGGENTHRDQRAGVPPGRLSATALHEFRETAPAGRRASLRACVRASPCVPRSPATTSCWPRTAPATRTRSPSWPAGTAAALWAVAAAHPARPGGRGRRRAGGAGGRLPAGRQLPW